MNPRLLTAGHRRKGLTRNFPRLEPPWQGEAVLVLAHRGANRQAPENTIAAMARAVELGADGVELDVHRTADGHLVVRHDAATPAGELTDLTRGEIAAALPDVPALEDVLEVCRGKLVNIEAKADDPAAVDLVVGLLAARGGVDAVLVSSFHLRVVDRVRELGAPSAFLSFGLDPVQALDVAREHGHQALHPDVWTLTLGQPEEVAARAHEAGMRLNVWTVNEPDVMLRLRDAGIDGVITDVPDLALELLRG